MYLTVEKLDRYLTISRVNSMVPETGSLRVTFLNELITNASAQIDGYLSARYVVPVPASGYTEDICTKLCVYALYFARASGVEIPEKVTKARDDAVKDLKELGDGKRGLGGATPATQASVTTTSGIAMRCDSPTFENDMGAF